MHYSIISDQYDNQPITEECDWCEFVALLKDCSQKPQLISEKDMTECFLPARYAPLALRRKANVLSWDWAAVDLDDGAWLFDDVVEMLNLRGLCYVVYTTARHSDDHHKIRALFPLSKEVLPAGFDDFWYSLDQMFGGHVDHNAKDISRVFFGPRAWIGSPVRFASRLDGLALDPLSLAREFVPPPLPVPIPRKSVNHTSLATAPTADVSYANAVFKRAIDRLQRHGAGTTGYNSLLYKETALLAGYAASYLLDEAKVLDELEYISVSDYHPLSRAKKTISAAWQVGLRDPKTPPVKTRPISPNACRFKYVPAL